jgi:hypothetical protein
LSGLSRATSDQDEVDHDLAVAFRYLKGPRKKDVVGTARALRRLADRPRYPTLAAVGEAVGVSGEIVREFIDVLNLPDTVLAMYERGVLNGLEQGRRLAQLQRSRKGIVEETAKLMVGMRALDARAMVDYLIRNPGATPVDASAAVEASKGTRRREFHVVAILDAEPFRLLAAAAAGRKMPVDELVTEIVTAWLRENAK